MREGLAAEVLELAQSGQAAQAEARYRSALSAADPRHHRTPDIHGQYAGLLARMHRQAEAGQHLETALKVEIHQRE